MSKGIAFFIIIDPPTIIHKSHFNPQSLFKYTNHNISGDLPAPFSLGKVLGQDFPIVRETKGQLRSSPRQPGDIEKGKVLFQMTQLCDRLYNYIASKDWKGSNVTDVLVAVSGFARQQQEGQTARSQLRGEGDRLPAANHHPTPNFLLQLAL